MAAHSSTLAWKIPWTEEPGRLLSMGSLRVGRDWETSLSLFIWCTGEENGNPLQCSCLENPRDGGAWWAAVYGVAQSRTRLKRLSSSSRGLTPLDFKTYHKDTVTKTLWCWCQDKKKIDLWSRVENLEIYPHICEQLIFDKGTKAT